MTQTKNIKDYLHLYLGCEVYIFPDDTLLDGWLKNRLAEIPTLKFKIPLTIESLKRSFEHGYKPILRPLSDMTEEEAVEFIHLKNRSIMCNVDRTHITKVTFGSTKNIINFSYYRQMGAGAEAGSKTYYVNQSDADQFYYLLSQGFDLFGLIEAGLAIDKTKL